MTDSTAISKPAARATPDDFLYGFDVPDEETRQFLASIIASGQAPQDALGELRQLSLMRGVEEWDMLFGCASSLRDRSRGSARGDGLHPVGVPQVPQQGHLQDPGGRESQGTSRQGGRRLEIPLLWDIDAHAEQGTQSSISHAINEAKTPSPRGTVSSLPIPPLSADRFGLIQEELADDPFRLLVAVTFLIRTAGKTAIPVFRQLMERFPTPEALAGADPAEIISLIRPLGLSAVRCAAIQKYARLWLERPPTREVRYGVKNYPRPGDGWYVRAGEEFGPEDSGGAGGLDEECAVDAVADARQRAIGAAWEIGHLTQGPYALDSWRIFCRDVLLGRSEHWTGKGSAPGFQPEWMRVLPADKELRACLRWMCR
ncbi:41b4cda4-de1b-4e16-8c3c-b740ad1db993 [Thermothielavioides terrestris]|uniref:41b4cda4-de1b-4e16-8c3c-b740ad1db993 n=1 Tax=Thermothielavioides terrestris TaxID=2587410 RepID=A0A446B8X4_9PEZI|nr:41b4cda4-de1b-4e16-8c3c-b740ad1db993 [Thermothielavioides terrestris]